MCTVCGCGQGETRIEGQEQDHAHEHGHEHSHHHPHSHTHSHGPGQEHAHPHSHEHEHDHDHGHEHDLYHDHDHDHDHEHHAHPDHDLAHGHEHSHGDDHHHYGLGPAHAHAPGLSQGRMVQIEQDILGKNDQYAAANRSWFRARGILALNLVSSPGSGKTSLLTRSIQDLKGRYPLAVIEGDQQTSHDADRIRATGIPALQINTGKGCHLDAHMVGHAIESLGLAEKSLLFIENVGNLVCPAAFDLGEAHKVAILSVTEGEDKPLKYPDMFHAADLMILNKIDLLPYLDFDMARCLDYARRVNPGIEILQVSARSGEGLDAWYAWLRARMA
ncbi:MAG: hydrogenase nickel incorporation protein HypB [Chromatiaceae bacterium]|nr:hydrogenase nickel incorporation protein HypB [Chromatiaceae bacterium]